MSGDERDLKAESEAPPGASATAFGKYQLFASLGRGGMADVFLAVARGQMGFNKLAVIKRLRQALAEEVTFRSMFLDEARLAARLNHPNVVHTYEVGEQNGVYFMAMEYLEGQSLNKVLKEAIRRRESFEPELSARIVADALAGLHHAHELRDYDGRPLSIIHRDVSPHNIFVTYDGHSKLVDFGIAKAALSSTETEVGVLKGKVAYMSPEQAMGTRIDARSDLFAMGIVLWELLTRQRLMAGEGAANTLHKLINEPIARPSSVVGGVDPTLEAIVMRSLEKDPARRFQSAAEMRDALERWLANQPQSTRQEDVGRKMMQLFATVREDVHRQIQRYMAAISSKSPRELEAINVGALQRDPVEGTGNDPLPRLGTGGTGSGIVSSFPSASMTSNVGTPATVTPSAAPPPNRNSALAIVLAVGFFVLAALLIVVVGLKGRRNDAPASAPPPVESAPPPMPSIEMPTLDSHADARPTDGRPIVPPAAVPTTPVNGTQTSKTSRQPSRPPASTTSAPTAPAPAPTSDEQGFLTLFVYPWAKVSEGGKTLCTTPCNRIPLSAGTHNLLLENSEQGLKLPYAVTIKSGETTTKTVGLK